MNVLAFLIQETVRLYFRALNGQLIRLKQMRTRRGCFINCSTILDVVERARLEDRNHYSGERRALMTWATCPIPRGELELLRHLYLQPGNWFMREEYENQRRAVRARLGQNSFSCAVGPDR